MPQSSTARGYLNAYELLLLQKILVIKFDLLDKKLDNLKNKDMDRIAFELSMAHSKSTSFDGETIAKFFNKSSKRNVPEFKGEILDTIVKILELPRISTWGTLKTTYAFPLRHKKDFLPNGHLKDLSDERKGEIIGAVRNTLGKIYPDENLSK